MKTAVITVKTYPELKRRAEQFARGTGMSLSDVVNLSLRQTINQGSITIEEPYVPNKKTAKELGASLKDIKAGKNLSPVFSSAKEMDGYLNAL